MGSKLNSVADIFWLPGWRFQQPNHTSPLVCVWVKVGGLSNLIVIIFQKEEKGEGVCCTGVCMFKLCGVRACFCPRLRARVCVFVHAFVRDCSI